MIEHDMYGNNNIEENPRLKILHEIASFSSRIMREKDPQVVAKEAMKTVATKFSMSEMILTLWDENVRRFKFFASYGYSPEVEKEIHKFEYGTDWITMELDDKFRIAEDVYFINAEDFDPVEIDDILMDHKDEIDRPQEYENQWHEKDFFEFVLRDHENEIIGTIELNDSLSEDLPDIETLLSISIFFKVAGIFFNIANIRAKQLDSMDRIEALMALMSLDIKKSLERSSGIIDNIRRRNINTDFKKRALQDIASTMDKSIGIIERVEKLRSIEKRPYSLFVLMDFGTYVARSVDKFKKETPNVNISIRGQEKSIYYRCDPSLQECIISCLDSVNSIKKAPTEDIIVEIFINKFERGIEELNIAFSSKDIDFLGWHKLAMEIRAADPKKIRLGSAEDYSGKFLMVFIARKYGGSIGVEEHRKGEFGTEGSLILTLPII